MEKDLVSICIPVFNGEKFLEQAIRSIIKQTYTNIEIIVSDNASTDNSIGIVEMLMDEDCRIKLNINEKNLGFSGNLNKLINLANSEYIALYHADDVYEDIIIEEQIKYLQINNELAGCFTLAKFIDEKNEFLENRMFLSANNIQKNIIVHLDDYISNLFEHGTSTFMCPTAMIKKSVYDKIGPYDTELKYIEDQDMYIRILEKYNMGIIGKELVHYRIHESQGSTFYRREDRNELNPHVVHIRNYLSKNVILKERFSKELNIFISRDYLVLVENNVFKGNKHGISEYINQSKQYYIFPRFSKLWFLQNSNNRIVYLIVKIIFFIKMHINTSFPKHADGKKAYS